ncbi:MAG: HAD family hydrolase [Planctomycetota bacterium]|jgi:putative hydrolase of the HAD superfamily
MTISHIVCDLGAVLIELHWAEHAGAIFGRPMTVDELHRIWVGFDGIRLLETGQIDYPAFLEQFRRDTASPLSCAEIDEHFRAIVGKPFADAIHTIDTLRQRYTVAALSNTNPPHVDTVRADSDLLDHFDHLFLSYEMGLIKPDAAIYEAVCQQLNCPGEQILFVDDGRPNVEAARRCGMHAVQVTSPAEIIAALDALSQA